MASCKDCLHFEICREYAGGLEQLLTCDNCEDFKDRSRFVELPYPLKPRDKVWYILEGLDEIDLKNYDIKSGDCAVGNVPDTVIEVGTCGFWVNQLSERNEDYLVPDDCDFISWDEIGKSYFLTHEEAVRAIERGKNNENQ